MRKRTDILVLDASYLAWKAFHSGHRRKEEKPAVVGFLVSLIDLLEEFYPHQTAFCWDPSSSLNPPVTPSRVKAFPGYKARPEPTVEELARKQDARRQFIALRYSILPDLGFMNQLGQDLVEADDIIATIVRRNRNRKVTVISADADLLQLVDDCTYHNPNHGMSITRDMFKSAYGMEPRRWYMVKAIAGCSSDKIPGVEGIGERTALKYLRGELKKNDTKAIKIRENWQTVRKNIELTRLPHPDTKKVILRSDTIPEIRQVRRTFKRYHLRTLLKPEMWRRWEDIYR